MKTLIYDENLQLKNVFRLENIIDRNGDLKSMAYFYSKNLDYSDVLNIRRIYEALPVEWKRSRENTDMNNDIGEDEMTFIRNGRGVALDKITSKDLYLILVKNISDEVSVREKIRNLYHREFSEKDITAIF